MGYRDRLKRQVVRLAPEHEPALRKFQRATFGASAPQLDEAHFSWLVEQNPYRDAGGPSLWVYFDGEEVVGQQAGIPFELKVDDRYYHAAWAIDLMVHPTYRVRGIGPILNEVFREHHDVIVGTGITDEAYKAFRQTGWTDLGRIPLYVRPLDVRGMLEGRGADRGLRRTLATMARPGVRIADVTGEVYARGRGVRLEAVDHFDERVDALWNEVSRGYRVLARRDYRTLRWRFDAPPASAVYQRFYLLQRDQLRGYVVLRLTRRHGVVAGTMVDFLCKPHWMTPLFALCLPYFRRAGAAAVYCQMMHPQARRRLYPLGFIRRESGAHIMFHADPCKASIGAVASDARAWFLTLADSDSDHPRPAQTGGPDGEDASPSAGHH